MSKRTRVAHPWSGAEHLSKILAVQCSEVLHLPVVRESSRRVRKCRRNKTQFGFASSRVTSGFALALVRAMDPMMAVPKRRSALAMVRALLPFPAPEYTSALRSCLQTAIS